MSSQSQKSQALLSLWGHLVLTHTHTHSLSHTHTLTHTHVGFAILVGTLIGVMVFVLYRPYILSPYTNPTPKLSLTGDFLHFYILR